MRRELDGWRSAHRRSADGGIDSDECVRAARPVVPPTPEGALDLGRLYWHEVERASRRIVRLRPDEDGLELCLLGVGPALLRFGSPELVVGDAGVWRRRQVPDQGRRAGAPSCGLDHALAEQL